MPDYTRVNLRQDVQDMAPRFGMEGIEARSGHTHSQQEEEVYVIAFGAPNTDNKDAELRPNWWPEG